MENKDDKGQVSPFQLEDLGVPMPDGEPINFQDLKFPAGLPPMTAEQKTKLMSNLLGDFIKISSNGREQSGLLITFGPNLALGAGKVEVKGFNMLSHKVRKELVVVLLKYVIDLIEKGGEFPGGKDTNVV